MYNFTTVFLHLKNETEILCDDTHRYTIQDGDRESQAIWIVEYRPIENQYFVVRNYQTINQYTIVNYHEFHVS